MRQFVGVSKPSKTDSGFRHTKEEAIEALREAWVLERDWRAEMRKLTAHDYGGMTHWVALVAWEGYERPANSAHEKSPEAEAPGRCVDGC